MGELSFFWHDYETFGAVPRRDRPAQFAGVRTDAELQEIDDPVCWYCRPAPDYLPDPESVLLTGITPQRALAEGLPEQEFAARIEAQLAREGTVGVGYNSIRFDDEVTRHLLWRNLYDPYAREWANGCGRWDLLDVVRLTWALRPEGFVWPDGDDGRPSFRLERLAAANGVAQGTAHEALADVRATLALARQLKLRQPRLWEFASKLRRKEAVRAEIGEGRPFVHLSGRYPLERGCLAIVWPLAPHPINKNELIVWDLAHDPAELETLDADAARTRLYTRSDELRDGQTRLPIKTIHVNKSPIVISNLKVLGDAPARFGIDVAAALRHAERARRLPPRDAVWAALFARPATGAAVDVDEDLYGGFVGNDDRRQLERLRALAPEALAGKRPSFADARLDELLFRYRARNFAHTLDADEQGRWDALRAQRLHHGAGGGLTLAAFFERIDELAESADDREQDLLEALYDYGQAIAPEAP